MTRAIAKTPPIKAAAPATLDWIIGVFAVLIQQGAFLSLPLMISGLSPGALRGAENPLNSLGVALASLVIFSACAFCLPGVVTLFKKNASSALYLFVISASWVWSIHPDLTFRRGLGYLLTMLTVAYLAVNFRFLDQMKVLSAGFAISALASLTFAAVFPQFGIMHLGDLDGDWRGVFAHKNVLGLVMEVAVFVETFIITSQPSGGARWRMLLLGLFLLLVLLSGSQGALLTSVTYCLGAAAYCMVTRMRLGGVFISGILVVAVFVGIVAAIVNPEASLGLLGKDVGLSGRTALWPLVLALVLERPLLGWGYQATWQVGDATTILTDALTGNWGVTNSQNALLEIALQLGIVGAALVIVILFVALLRACRSVAAGILPLGWFSLLLWLGTVVTGQTEITFGQNQIIGWVAFNLFSFGCASELRKRAHPKSRDVSDHHVGWRGLGARVSGPRRVVGGSNPARLALEDDLHAERS